MANYSRPERMAIVHEPVTLSREVVTETGERLEGASIRLHARHQRRKGLSWEQCDEVACINDRAALAALKAELEGK